MSKAAGPFDLASQFAIFSPEGASTVKPFSPTFFDELVAEHGHLDQQFLVSQYSFDAPWETWEMHPTGDELVYLISGATDFALWENGKERVVNVRDTGSYVIVPAGTWHTARPQEPTTMLFVTPGKGTQNANEPPR